VVGWGWYYSIEVLDDYSRFVLASDLKPDMTADSISDVVEQAVAFTGMRQVPIEDSTKLLSDHGSGYLARAFEEYLRMLEIRHIYCAPHHPQTKDYTLHLLDTLRYNPGCESLGQFDALCFPRRVLARWARIGSRSCRCRRGRELLHAGSIL
jgi:Integrase core domain